MRALATTALVLISLVLPVAAKASDCGNAESLDQAREVSKAKVASNEFSSVVEFSGAELAAFVKAANEQLAAQIPDTGIDNLLALSVHGRVVVYAYRAGCQVGFVVLRAMPKLGE